MVSRKKLADAIRILTIDSVQKANSGHPGAPMGMADIAEVLWRDYMNHNPCNPKWINRDRFVLSNGHGSMLLYSLLHLTGYNLSIEEIKRFRQLDSKTPGHPEYKCTNGVETTTGPLGQGIATAVGLAIGERTLSAQFNLPGYNIIDHYTYVFLGDGCMMEGISHEACSLAGTIGLGKLIAFYDRNNISIDGSIEEWFSEDTALRFESYGWHVIKNIDGHDSNSIKSAIESARSVYNKPSLLICNTTIAFGSPNKSGSNISHGSPLGESEVLATRKHLNWESPPFVIPKEIYLSWDARKIGEKKEISWNRMFYEYEKKFPKLSSELKRRVINELPKDWKVKSQDIIEGFYRSKKCISGRKASQNVLEEFSKILPEFLGGSADLTMSNLSFFSTSVSIIKSNSGNYIHYGVREFAMTSIGNGISQYGGFLPYTATFLIFSEYGKNAIRMAALMRIRHIMIYTHDSIGIGEDGPTHQPIEQLSSLRIIPNMSVWRPCDQIETAVAWKNSIERKDGPTAIILSRQNLVQYDRTKKQLEDVSKGGYILRGLSKNPDLILIATGSEVELAVSVYEKLEKENKNIRVVSLPSVDVFDSQDESYKELVIPSSVICRIAIEAGSPDFWYKYVGLNGEVIGISSFGKSANPKDLFEFFGFTVKNILEKAKLMLSKIKDL